VTFGALTALRPGPPCGNNPRWYFRCECGVEKLLKSFSVRHGRTRSCGCIPAGKFVHGMSGTPEYRIWKIMRQRCTLPSADSYHLYGGNGVTVCERWRHSFEAFYADMGPRPSPSHSIDRYPNASGNYEPSNCRWATWTQQNRNRQNNKRLLFRGETKTVAEWAEVLAIPAKRVYDRLARGWSIEHALTRPARNLPSPIRNGL